MFLCLELYAVPRTVAFCFPLGHKRLPESSPASALDAEARAARARRPETRFKQRCVGVRRTLLYTVESTLFPSRGEGI